MKENIHNRLKEIETEDFIFLIFIIIILLSFVANNYERKYFINGDNEDKINYYYLQILIFLVIFIINIYYVLNSYLDIINLSDYESDKRKKYAYLGFVASLSALIATTIILYIAIMDIDIEAEISI